MRKFIAGVLFFVSFYIYADIYSGSSESDALIVRAPVWVFVEEAPKVSDDEDKAKFIPPKEALLELSSYIISGMTYGLKFSYTPSDKKRNVKEYFELESVFKPDPQNIRFTDVRVKYPYCYSWAEYGIPESYAGHFKLWTKNSHKTIKGRGHGDRFEELAGVYAAYTDAVKNAVRDYARGFLKNKPKEIKGAVLIKSPPRLFVESGFFKAELELYIQIDEIIKYTVF
ncbi:MULTISPECIES: hypothetical protein [unclassified Treponema]|uniref:hypothetical protein n=1 Tax=unclassified Treponema TaxID=2638727 RepID=UPI0020A3AE77|nr:MULTISPECIES: hypothetical protein [unclassified Treponema]UTC66894.1 hypothetical protein E4O06_13260 [Treponema sp. OMZ 789]UTC69623.1 hypothetical protein E4O01_13400 [Treponema sp. OMZ 790]UTC72337.1 hypothetical protein E4O02_13490 [Treponema sp. OMZ 791]